ncbi:hypothetical protein J4214_03765 [Candidatus Woesearchaeota archaeon]|nr:hypothetical protein [Candidatus Woesearchaeota archaeon]
MAEIDFGIMIILLFVMLILSIIGGLKLWGIYKGKGTKYAGIILIVLMASFLIGIFIIMPILLVKLYAFGGYNFYVYFLNIMISPIAIMSLYFWVFYKTRRVKFVWIYLILSIIFFFITLFYMVLLVRAFLSL